MSATANGPAGLRDGLNQPSPVTRAVVLGFYDGATGGVLQIGDRGPVYRFDLPEGVDEGTILTAAERPFELRRLPDDALDRLVAVLTPHLPPEWPVWYVRWEFPDEQVEREVSARVEEVLAEAGPPTWRITTPDPWNFSILRAERVIAGRGA